MEFILILQQINGMKENNNNKNILLCAFLIVTAVLSRVINLEFHLLSNFACLGAISLFSGNIIKNKSYAYLIPLLAYLVSDLFIAFTGQQGFYGLSQFFVYGSMILIVFLGTKMGQPKTIKVLGFSLASSAIFWIVSNFGVWFANEMMASTNPMHEQGLTLGFTFVRALPFYNKFGTELFAGTFIGDLAYSSVLFGAYAILKNKIFAPKAIAG
jgi:hypothetical protein